MSNQGAEPLVNILYGHLYGEFSWAYIRSAWWLSALQSHAPESASFWQDFSIIACWQRGAAETSVTGKWGIMKVTCFKGSFQELYQFHGKFVSARTKAIAALANRRRSITWRRMWENDIPKQNSTPHFSPRGENGRTNHMWQCQSCCLMHCSGTFRYCRDVDNIRTSLGLHSTEVKWRKLEGHGPDFQKPAQKSFMSSFQHDIFYLHTGLRVSQRSPLCGFYRKIVENEGICEELFLNYFNLQVRKKYNYCQNIPCLYFLNENLSGLFIDNILVWDLNNFNIRRIKNLKDKIKPKLFWNFWRKSFNWHTQGFFNWNYLRTLFIFLFLFFIWLYFDLKSFHMLGELFLILLGSRLSIPTSMWDNVKGHHKDDYMGSRVCEVHLLIHHQYLLICYSSVMHLKLTWVSKNSFGSGFGE